MKKLFALACLLLTAQTAERNYYAQLDANGVVLRVIVADQAFINSGAVGDRTRWVRAFKDRSDRRGYPGIGYTFNRDLNAFIAPRPFPSWTLNETTLQYDPPVPMPSNNGPHRWNEALQRWERFRP